MGYDCTLHLVDETAIRTELVPWLLEQAPAPVAFREAYGDETDEIIRKVRTAVRSGDGRLVTQLGVMFSACRQPYEYKRGFCLSMWLDLEDELEIGLPRFPAELVGDPGALFAGVTAAFPALAGQYPRYIDGNYCTGNFIPADRVAAALAWLETTVAKFPQIKRTTAVVERVLAACADAGLAYWEATDLGLPEAKPVPRRPGAGSAAGLEVLALPSGAGSVLGADDRYVIGYGFAIDVRAWPPLVTVFDVRTIGELGRAPNGQWLVSLRDPDEGPDELRVVDSPFEIASGSTLRILERDVSWSALGFLDGRAVGLPAYPHPTWAFPFVQEGDVLTPKPLVPPYQPPSRDVRPVTGFAYLRDGRDVLVWNGRFYTWRGDTWSADPVKIEAGDAFSWAPAGDDGLFYLSGRKLFEYHPGASSAGPKAIRHLPWLSNIMQAMPGPQGGVLLLEGTNPDGDVGKLYLPEQGLVYAIHRDLFEIDLDAFTEGLLWLRASDRIAVMTSDDLRTVPLAAVTARPPRPAG